MFGSAFSNRATRSSQAGPKLCALVFHWFGPAIVMVVALSVWVPGAQPVSATAAAPITAIAAYRVSLSYILVLPFCGVPRGVSGASGSMGSGEPSLDAGQEVLGEEEEEEQQRQARDHVAGEHRSVVG